MSYIITFVISVMASIVAYYICKWLDRLAETRVSAYRLPRGRLDGVAAVTPLHGTLSLGHKGNFDYKAPEK